MTRFVLAAEGVVVERDGRRVLDGVSCVLERGACIALVGPNGGGKSTLVRALAGLIPLRAGVVRRGEGMRPPAVVFEQAGIVSGLTVAENIGFPLVRARLPAARIDERVSWALARFDLTAFEHVPAERLTRGLAVRLQLARAALLEPDALLCDAPLDALDPVAAEEIARLLQRAAGSGMVVLVTTNAPDRVRTFSAQQWRIEQGRLEAGRMPGS